MKAAKINNVEDRRVQWTTHKNFRDARIKGNHSTSIAPHLVVDEIEAKAALRNIVDTPTEEGAEEGAEHGVNDGEMDAV
jgi:hypothetical protein